MILRDINRELFAAVEARDTERAKKLLKEGANPFYRFSDRPSCLLKAAELGAADLVDLFVQTELEDEDKGEMLVAYAAGGHAEEVRRLLAEGIYVDARGYGCSTPLISAARHGHGEIVNILLDAGADIDWEETYKLGTALMQAAENGHTHIVRRLLEAGADTMETSRTGWIPLTLAAREGHDDIVRMLSEANPEADYRGALLHAYAAGGYVSVFLILVN